MALALNKLKRVDMPLNKETNQPPHTKVSKRLDVNLRIVQRIQKEMDELNGDYSVCIMVLGVVSNNDDVVPPFILPHGLRLNTEAWTKSLKEIGGVLVV